MMRQVPIEIPGLTYFSDFLSREEEVRLLKHIDASPWLGDLRRRVQHYGYKYDYKARKIDRSMALGDLPAWTDGLQQRLVETGLFSGGFDQLIVNEYQPGQGIAAHVDCEPCFLDGIVSISLGSSVVMDFSQPGKKVPVVLSGRSAVILNEASRYEWKHGIAGRKSDVIEGIRVPRNRRVSLTFRKVIL